MVLDDRRAQQLEVAGAAVEDLAHGVLAQRLDALLARQALDVEDRAAGRDQLAQVVVDDEDLVEADAAAVAGAEALGAADGVVDLDLLAAAPGRGRAPPSARR